MLLTFQTLPTFCKGKEQRWSLHRRCPNPPQLPAGTAHLEGRCSAPQMASCCPQLLAQIPHVTPLQLGRSLPSLSLSRSCWLAISDDWLRTASDIRAELSAFPAIKLIPGKLSNCTCGESSTQVKGGSGQSIPLLPQLSGKPSARDPKYK